MKRLEIETLTTPSVLFFHIYSFNLNDNISDVDRTFILNVKTFKYVIHDGYFGMTFCKKKKTSFRKEFCFNTLFINF